MDWILYLLLLAISVAGVLLNILTLPGLWLMALAAAGYAWATHLDYLGWHSLIALLLLAGVGELVEFFASTAGAKRAGASRRGFWGAIIGGFLGAIILTIPLWFIGTFVGILIGTFVGALVGELSGGQKIENSLRIGVGAAKGRFLGTMGKLAVGAVMFVVIFVSAMPLRSRKASVMAAASKHSQGSMMPPALPAPATAPVISPPTTK